MGIAREEDARKGKTMEQRLIDANAAIQWVEENVYYTDKFKRIMEGVIDKQPTVDAVPVVHAYWKTIIRHEHFPSGKPYEADYCSNPKCGRRGSMEFEYCPWCGARMDAGADGERKDDGN